MAVSFILIRFVQIEGLLHDQRAVHIYAAQHIVALWCLSVIVTSIARRVM